MIVSRIAPAGLALTLAACAGGDTAPVSSAAAGSGAVPDTPANPKYTYECEGYTFTAFYRPEEMTLWLRDGQRVLPQVRSASGARYSDGEVEFFGKGDKGMLSIGDSQYRDCVVLTRP
ncbi:MliC family protein [Parahaliea mediterranea]|uniref:MliC family protein n=1 Tax=Parahaliea mediterranea TaxID=651086 RepID=A0A939INH0_9GAMM|nr:MliC family protein [Parahaliea mediterranea]MBN7798047.1 MliC family protein [Parahaliea mediterranea]